MRRGNKYGARKTTLDGITFDSQAEASYYRKLLLLKGAGEITEIELQPVFILQESKTRADGTKLLPIKYKADFRVTYKDGRQEIIDVKGHKTKEYIMKKKMFLFRYPDLSIKEVKA